LGSGSSATQLSYSSYVIRKFVDTADESPTAALRYTVLHLLRHAQSGLNYSSVDTNYISSI